MTSQQDPFTTLTDLFTTPLSTGSVSEPPVEPARAMEITPRIECLVPGHLPVRAAVWFGPCAWSLNQDADAGGLLRIEDDSTCLSCMSTSRLPELGSGPSLSAAIERLARQCRRWSVVPPVHWDAVHLATVGFDRITILSGTNQAAVVAAYQMCKTFAGLPSAVQIDLGICFAGSDERTSHETGQRLADTVREQLGFELALRGSLHRIDSGGADVQSCRCDHHEHGLDGLVSDIHRGIATAMSDRPGEPVSSIDTDAVDPAAVPKPSPTPVPEPMVEIPPPPLVVTDDLVEPLDLDDAEPRRIEEPASQHLAEFVTGLAPLPVSSPTCSDVDLGVDPSGRVHCLCREANLRQLRVAARWVLDHHHLLSLACPDTLVASPLEPTCHLFTSHPPDLSDLHGSGLRLHLLTQVRVGSESTWFACPLS